MKALNAKVSATRRKLTVYAFFKAFWPFLTFVAIFLAIALAGVIDRMGSRIPEAVAEASPAPFERSPTLETAVPVARVEPP